MSTDNKKQGPGAEKAPGLSEQTETVSNANAEGLEEKVTALEAAVSEKETLIQNLETEKAELQGKLEKAEAKITELEKKQPKQVKAKKDETIIRFTLSPAGKFKLPYNVGQEVAMDKEVAAEIVEAKYAEYVK
ncbi:hypothetical protein [Myroides sp. DF42-4-2]|uniref:hypothetical protein n=1 Tax=unclassified Myroides TaxID=2642485 RepID=UPI002577BB1D|nr:hypothetical protein [Myroides sp. DF42-4-2]MDM1408060.1 hypothetical protein [Myroides sp. DF42-4-2]